MDALKANLTEVTRLAEIELRQSASKEAALTEPLRLFHQSTSQVDQQLSKTLQGLIQYEAGLKEEMARAARERQSTTPTSQSFTQNSNKGQSWNATQPNTENQYTQPQRVIEQPKAAKPAENFCPFESTFPQPGNQTVDDKHDNPFGESIFPTIDSPVQPLHIGVPQEIPKTKPDSDEFFADEDDESPFGDENANSTSQKGAQMTPSQFNSNPQQSYAGHYSGKQASSPQVPAYQTAPQPVSAGTPTNWVPSPSFTVPKDDPLKSKHGAMEHVHQDDPNVDADLDFF